MPEGHTLFALARDLHEAFAGTAPQVTSPQGKFAEGAAQLDGRQLLHATSRGKHLFVEFAGDRWLHVHLGLIGSFTVDEHAWTAEVPAVGQVRLRLRTDQHVADLRGPNLCEVATPERVDAVLAKLGPDPLRADADWTRAWARIARSRKPVGALLMDQRALAGVGNVYRAELLFRHRMHPHRPGNTLRRSQFEAMWHDLVALMGEGVLSGRIDTVRDEHTPEAMGRPPRVDDHGGEVYVYRRHGQPCHVCGARVRTEVLEGRNLFWCPRCQPSFRSRAGRT